MPSLFNKNNLKTVGLLSLLTGGLVTAGAALGGRSGLLIGTFLGFAMVGGSYWFSDKLAIRASGARELAAGELQWLQDDVREMAARAGMQQPRIFLSPSPQPNAFATGRNERHAVVAITNGLLELLDRREVRGVVAHELGHIKNKDILIGSIAAAIATGISSLANMAMFAGMFGGNDEDRPNPFVLILMMLVAPLAASIIQMALSRSREFEADAAGAAISGDPAALAQALAKIEAYAARIPMQVSPAQAQAYIVNPLTGRNMQFANLFRTHPPTEERIARLRSRPA
jgi:heat shock protein HtpX